MNTDQILAHARARFDHESNRRLLKEKYLAKLTFVYNGGLWRASPEMITFLSLYGEEEVVVLDLYENPVRVQAGNLCLAMKQRWQEQMNAWLVEYEEAQKKR